MQHAQRITQILNTIDKVVKDKKKQGYEFIQLSAGYVASEIGIATRTLREHGFPIHLHKNYGSCTWQKYKGLHIDIDQYLSERKKEKHQEKLQNIQENTHSIPF